MSENWLGNLKKIINFPLAAKTESRPPVNVLDVFMIILGMFIYSLSINLFLVNARLLSGGLTGIGLILQYTIQLPSAVTIFILNIPLFLLSWLRLSRRFTGLTILGVTASVIFLALTEPLSPLMQINDILLCCILGGALKGVGLGMALAHQGSSGGLDIVSVYLRKKDNHINIGSYFFAFNIIIVLLGTLFFGLASGVYTVVSLYISSLVIDQYIERVTQRKALLIISRHPEEIAQTILHDIKRGVTFLYGEGAYSKEKGKIIFCIVPVQQLFATKQSVLRIDPTAFLSVINTAEVEGRGFYHMV